jgi:hypothetical protein
MFYASRHCAKKKNIQMRLLGKNLASMLNPGPQDWRVWRGRSLITNTRSLKETSYVGVKTEPRGSSMQAHQHSRGRVKWINQNQVSSFYNKMLYASRHCEKNNIRFRLHGKNLASMFKAGPQDWRIEIKLG